MGERKQADMPGLPAREYLEGSLDQALGNAPSQKSGWTESGPKNPTLPQLTAKLVPTSSPSTSAAKLADGSAR